MVRAERATQRVPCDGLLQGLQIKAMATKRGEEPPPPAVSFDTEEVIKTLQEKVLS